MIKPTKYPVGPDDMADLFDQASNQGKNGKQDTLVSGTNIKTINGASVLGSGDLTVSGSGATWGSITGTLSSQTDLNIALSGKESSITAGTTAQYYRGDKTFQTLDKSAVGLSNVDNTTDAGKPISTATQTALNAKQDSLVSGTSIKTVNGNTLLGSGDVTINGNPKTLTSIVGSNLIGTANQISASYRIAGGTIATNNSIYIRNLLTKSAGSTASTARIYINTSNSLTGATLLATAGSMTSTTYIQRFERNFYFDGTNLYVYNPSNAISTDLTSGTLTSVAFNPAIDYFLIFAVQNSTTTPDNLGHKRVIIQLYD